MRLAGGILGLASLAVWTYLFWGGVCGFSPRLKLAPVWKYLLAPVCLIAMWISLFVAVDLFHDLRRGRW